MFEDPPRVAASVHVKFRRLPEGPHLTSYIIYDIVDSIGFALHVTYLYLSIHPSIHL